MNLAKFELKGGFSAGIFASYHVYPFNPEFIIYDPAYVATKDRNGKTNSYLGYMLDLVKAHEGVPVFVTEFGLPSSFGVAHINKSAWDHGGYTESAQASATIELYDAIVDSGAAGAVIFEWIDEWFKRTWMTNPTMLPKDRGPMWYDVLSPEESFGIKSYFPVPGQSVRIDGDLSDWPKDAFTVHATGGKTGAGKLIARLRLHSDPAFLYIAIEASGFDLPPTADKDAPVLLIGLSTVDGNTGSTRWPDGLTRGGKEVEVTADHGMESVIVLDPGAVTWRLLTEKSYDPTPRLNGGGKTGGVPTPNDDGAFRLARWMINNDAQYIAAGSKLDVERYYCVPGELQAGDSATLTTAHFMSRARESGGSGDPGGQALEIRIPWHALWVTDPSSRQVLYDDAKTDTFDARTTKGIRAMALLATRNGKSLQALDGGTPTANVPVYAWPTWDLPSSAGERAKPLFDKLKARWADALPERKL